MIRRYGFLWRLLLVAADFVLAIIVIIFAANLRFGRGLVWPADVSNALPHTNQTVFGFAALWVAVLWAQGLYRSRARWTRRSDLYAVIRATVIQLALTMSLLYLLKLPDVSRMWLVVTFPSLAVAGLGIRIVVRQILVLARDHGRNARYMLIVGANPRARAFADLVESHADLGIVVIGHLQADAADVGAALSRPHLGMIEDLEQVLHAEVVDEVAICLPFSQEELIEQTAYLCEQEGKVVRMPIAPIERVLTTGRLESIDGIGVYSLTNGPDRVLGLIAKRALDLVGAATALMLISPVMLVLAILVKLDSPGPVFFRQERVGLHGRSFNVIKFRSMIPDAEHELDTLMEHNEIQGHAFKIDNDPRITGVGRLLRRSSLDELPQFWNVLRGQMSLVGPRPPLPREVANYDIWHRRRLSMKPGITGLWQVGSRRCPEFDRWVEQDLEYIDSWSLWLDFKIMARTLPAVLMGSGR
jgi:exopolysaccharide biosynthesis polyprenyl glycosylphosphotransferase